MATKVLVVDDELDTLNLLRVLLELTGFEPVTTLNSTEAITLAEIEQVDVALLDIMMPQLDGFQLCRMMREHQTLKDLPIIFVTAYDALDLEDRRKEVGADHVVHKPINIDLLTDVINDIQQKKQAKTNHTPPPSTETSPEDKQPVSTAEKPKAQETPKATSAPVDTTATTQASESAKPLTPETPETPKSTSAPTATEDTKTKPEAVDKGDKSNGKSAEEEKTSSSSAKSSEPEVAKEEKTEASPSTENKSVTDEESNTGSTKSNQAPIKPHRPPTPQ